MSFLNEYNVWNYFEAYWSVLGMLTPFKQTDDDRNDEILRKYSSCRYFIT